MKDRVTANKYRHHANEFERIAANWLSYAKNKVHPKRLRIKAAAHYRDNMRSARKYREMAEKYS